MIYVVPALSRVTVPAEAAGVPGTIANVDFTFPSRKFVVGLLVIPADGTPETLAQLAISILDEEDRQIVTDFRGVTLSTQPEVLPFFAPLHQLFGRSFHPFALQRIVDTFDHWRFSMVNFGGAVGLASTALIVTEAPPRP